MPESPDYSQRDEEDIPERSGGVDVEGDVAVDGDVAGRDVVKPVTVVGYSAKAVQRLVITVGALVFATAACFFSGGILLGAKVFADLDRPPLDGNGQPVNSSEAAAVSMQRKVHAAQNLPPGQTFALEFSEDELSSYVGFIAGPPIGLSDGKARFVEPGLVAVGGQLQSLGNLPIAATFRVQDNLETHFIAPEGVLLPIAATFRVQVQSVEPFRLESMAVNLLQTEGTTFGWVTVPNFLVESFANQAISLLGGFTLIDLQAVPGADQWIVIGQGQ